MAQDRFTDEFKEAIADYIAYLAQTLEISNWRIILDDGYPAEDDVAAQIGCTYGRRVATLQLAKDFFSAPAEKQRHYLIHEVVHVMTEGMDNIIENKLDELIGKPAFTVLHEAWAVQVEYHVDQLAYIIEDLIADIPQHKLLLDVLIASENND